MFLSQLRSTISNIDVPGWNIETLEECPTSDIVIRTSCYVAFFSIVERAELIRDVADKAQTEIAGAQVSKGSEWPRDLNLVLITLEDTPPCGASIRELVDDRYLCRKFVLCVNGRKVSDLLSDLPFWPLDDALSGAMISPIAGVQEVMSGYDPNLITDLAKYRPGADRVYEKIFEKKYKIIVDPTKSETASPSKKKPSTRTKLAGLDIIGFRGIKQLRKEEMPLSGDVVFIYGPNGVGKTSIADALEWTITGRIDRLERALHHSERGDPDPIINVFSLEREAKVTCHLTNIDFICRLKHGSSVSRMIGNQLAHDDRMVIDHVVGTKAPSPEVQLRPDRLRNLFRGSHMLSQHDIRQFLERTDGTERFDILTNMIGAEEFVQFREKVINVLHRLQSRLKNESEQSKFIKNEMADVSRRLHERQNGLNRQSQVLSSNRSSQELASGLLEKIRRIQITVDETIIKQANSEPIDQRVELISVYLETLIKKEKSSREGILVRLESLDKELAGYIESRERSEFLRTQIAGGQKITEKTHIELQDKEKLYQSAQTHLDFLKMKQSEAKRKYSVSSWLKQNLPEYKNASESLRKTEEAILNLREQIQRRRDILQKQQKTLADKLLQMQKLEQETTATINRERAVTALVERLPNVLINWQTVEQIGIRENQLNAQIGELSRKLTSVQKELHELQAYENELQRIYNVEAAQHDVLSSFLTKLSAFINEPECPLCGRNFQTIEEAKDIIRGHLSGLPLKLKELAFQLDNARKRTESGHRQADSITAGIQEIKTTLETARSEQSDARKIVHNFISECAGLGISISTRDTHSWLRILEEAKSKYQADNLKTKIIGLTNETMLLDSDCAKEQNAINGLEQESQQYERERTKLHSTTREIEADMAERGLDQNSLPNENRISANLSQAQDEMKDYDESLDKTQNELKAVQSLITELRRNLKSAGEDVASKEAQLRQYESICNRFLSECHTVGVDESNPSKSIQMLKAAVIEFNNVLSALEEENHVLQRLTALDRLRKEVDELTRAKENVKLRFDEVLHEQSQTNEWVSHFEHIESQIVKRQVDVVSTHLKSLEPTTQSLYYRLNPHPIFEKVRINVDDQNHQLDVEVETSKNSEGLNDMVVSPTAFFSDAQMNSLAITVFLAGALRQRWSGFDTILIDDPVQQMDEMNVYAFIDLIRGLSRQRQFIIFTCNRDFYLLALERLVCLNDAQQRRFLAYRLEGIAPAEFKVSCDTPLRQ